VLVVYRSVIFGEVWEIFKFDNVLLAERDLELTLRVPHRLESIESLEQIRGTDRVYHFFTLFLHLLLKFILLTTP
jgi:hypothetical protein